MRMDDDPTDSAVSSETDDSVPEAVRVELEAKTFFETRWNQHLKKYVKQNPQSTNTVLFSYLALLKAYVPESHLHMQECQRVLGPPDPIHGGPPFRERMEPFTVFIEVATPDKVCMRYPMVAQRAVELLADSGINRSITAKEVMCLEEPQPLTTHFIKDLLVRRKMGAKGQEKFSSLISDILEHEKFQDAVFVLKKASSIFKDYPFFPQTLARLYYIIRGTQDYQAAERWAMEAIRRAPRNSYVADTLGQIYKNLLRKAHKQEEIIKWATESFRAFKHVEKNAEREVKPANVDFDNIVNFSKSFNNRGLFGFIQVAKTVFEKHAAERFPNLRMEVKLKFEFFEWYLTYSAPSMVNREPHFFWKDVALCYENFTKENPTQSTSFPGLLDLLNHGLFTSRGRRARFPEVEMTEATFGTIRDNLRATHEANGEDVTSAARYILSNILMSNLTPPAPQPALVKELQTTMHRFLAADVWMLDPVFHLLVLMLFWPEERLQHEVEERNEEDGEESEGHNEEDCEEVEDWSEMDSEEEEGQTEEDESDVNTWETETADHPVDPATIPPHLVSIPDLQQHVTFMEEAFEATEYNKYLRGRYLLPLFFLGKGSDLNKWIHRSRLDRIVEAEVDFMMEWDQDSRIKQKMIDEMWVNGEVWQVPQIRDILLPIRAEAHREVCEQQVNREEEVTVYVGSREIRARVDVETGPSALDPGLFYLGFTIRGPVVF